MKNLRKYSILIFIITGLSLSACSQPSINMDSSPPANTPESKYVTVSPISATPPIPSPEMTDGPAYPINIEELKQVIVSMINDDNWYRGSHSWFYEFEPKTYDINIYCHSVDGYVRVVFTEMIRERYFVFNFSPSERESGKYEKYATRISLEEDQEDIENNISREEYSFYTKSTVSIGEVEQPVYAELRTGDKDKIIADIENLVTDMLKHMKNAGDYILYIRDFDDNDYRTKVVVEDIHSSDRWLLSIVFLDDWQVRNHGGFISTDDGIVGYIKYITDQIKKVAIIEKEIHIDDAEQ